MRGTRKTRLGSVHARERAGVILATGNVGKSLAFDPTSVNTISRDAGLTWEEIVKGPHIYEFGNNGGLIVIARCPRRSHRRRPVQPRPRPVLGGTQALAEDLHTQHPSRSPRQRLCSSSVVHRRRHADGDPDGGMYTIDFNNLMQVDSTGKPTRLGAAEVRADEGLRAVGGHLAQPGQGILGRNATFTRRMRDRPASASTGRITSGRSRKRRRASAASNTTRSASSAGRGRTRSACASA